jgi:effector-binding domain-containing protein
MNLLKGVLYFLFIMLGASLLAALFAPGTKEVRRSIKIDAPVEAVFNQVVSFENWQKWDPWYQKDISQKRTYNGSVGDKTYGYKWQSDNDDVGIGSMTMNAAEYNERLDFTFHSDDGSSTGYFTFAPQASATEVEWVLVSELSYPMTIINYFIDGMVGSDYEEGLKNLKEYTEKTPLVDLLPKGKPVRVVEEHGIRYALVRRNNVPMSELKTFLDKGFKRVFMHIQTNGLVPKGPPCALYYKRDDRNRLIDVAAAVPLSTMVSVRERLLPLVIGQGSISDDYIACTLEGGYGQSYKMYAALNLWLQENDERHKNPVVEQYLIGINQVTDTSLYKTKVVYYLD